MRHEICKLKHRKAVELVKAHKGVIMLAVGANARYKRSSAVRALTAIDRAPNGANVAMDDGVLYVCCPTAVDVLMEGK